MRTARSTHARAIRGYTLLETMMALGCMFIILCVAYFFLRTGTILYAKNFSLDISNIALRSALDRMNSDIGMATDTPELINVSSDGTITTTSTGNANGVRFDRYLGGHYIVANPGSGLSGATSFTLQRSTNVMSSPPVPQTKDAVIIDGTDTRCIVSSCSVTSSTNSIQNLAVTMASGTTITVAWASSEKKAAELHRKVAFVVVGNQLRYYDQMEGVTNLGTVTPANILTYDVGTGTGESTPFSIVTKEGRDLVYIALRVQKTVQTNYTGYLANREASEYNTFLRIDTMIRPRNAN